MSLSFPIDLLADFPGWSTMFGLKFRQEQSRTANGRTFVKDLGDPLWTAEYKSRNLSINELDYWRARLDALENGAQTFFGRSFSRCFPIAYPNGSWPTGPSFSGNCQLASISSGRIVSLKGLPAGFQISIGDQIQIGDTDLHRVVESAAANGSGVTGLFEVRPHLWPLAAVDMTVKLKKPSCIMAIVPDSIGDTAQGDTGTGVITFQAMEAR